MASARKELTALVALQLVALVLLALAALVAALALAALVAGLGRGPLLLTVSVQAAGPLAVLSRARDPTRKNERPLA